MNDSLRARYITELLSIGLFLFFSVGCLSALKVVGASLKLWEIHITWGLGILLAVYLTAGVSGTHLNSAIAIVLWLFICFPGRRVLPYSIAQIVGAFGGTMLAYSLYDSLFIKYESAHQIIRGNLENL